MGRESTPVRLPGGLWRDGERHVECVVAPLPEDDPLPIDTQGSPAEWATWLLSRCVERVGRVEPFGDDDARTLTAGDREALLLAVRRATLGDRLPCVLECPNPECDERLEVDLSVGDLLVEPAGVMAVGPVHEATVGERLLRFRLPTGADQERAAGLAAHDVDAAARDLLCACVEELSAADASDPSLALTLAAHMEELDPQAEITLSLVCPECERPGTVAFDTATYLMDELARRARQLELDVHALALAYGWSERDIVALGPDRRRRYIERVAEATA